MSIRVIILFTCLLMVGNLYGQSICMEEFLSYYQAREYETCIGKVNEALRDDSFLKAEDAADILSLGFMCCNEYIRQTNLEIDYKNKEKTKAIIRKQEKIWENALNFFDQIENICNDHIGYGESIRTRHKYLTLLINSYSVYVAETTEDPDDDEEEGHKENIESDDAKKLKRLQLKYIKEIYPHLKDSQMEPTDVLTGYYYVMTFYYGEDMIEPFFDCLFNNVEPWFISHVVADTTLDKTVRLSLLSLYKAVVNLSNLWLEKAYEIGDKILIDILNLNIRSKNIAYYLKGNAMYKEHIDDRWQDIKMGLGDDEVAVEFFNAKNEDEHIFAVYFDKKMDVPKSRYCGHSYWAQKDLFGFSHLISSEEIKRYRQAYFSSTEEMAYIDMGMTDFTHKLHSLSEILMKSPREPSNPTICSFSNINYSLTKVDVAISAEKRGAVVGVCNLKGSRDELEFLKGKAGSRLTSFDHDNATKMAFTSLSRKEMDILHVSTHGFFDKKGITDAILSDVTSSITGAAVLSNCGLILSGYNDGVESGVITGEEIASLDLSKVGLVVLNACQTGVGDSRLADVYSLTEAFHQAGVRYIISSTDKIEDNAAKIFFISFMNEVYAGSTYHDAFVKARSASGTPEKFIFWE